MFYAEEIYTIVIAKKNFHWLKVLDSGLCTYTILTVCYSVPRNTSPRSIMQTELVRSVY